MHTDIRQDQCKNRLHIKSDEDKLKLRGKKNSYLYVVLVVTLNYRVSKEIIIRCQVLPLTFSPVHILLLPSKAVIVVSQAQDELDPISSGLIYNKIEPLNPTKEFEKRKRTQIIKILNFEYLKQKHNYKTKLVLKRP